ncbi:MAG: helix-turn-helix domain-containing protein [Oscillospiraceae bacterium]|nr:helix-turn-helix domain-containing protein [Oscillospiraceae bacterium]
MMTNKQFSQNLRKLRLQKALTQEQLAKHLGVSAQSVSRWECGTTLPDVLLLPQIARLYGITVDDLYREDPRGYPSYAQRLLAVYEASGRSEDFIAAEQEFLRMAEAELTADDLRSWGVLYHYMTTHCARLAQQKLEEAMEHPGVTDQIYCSAAQQKIALLCDLGRGKEEADRYDRLLETSPENPRLCLLCVAAHEFAGDAHRALEIAEEGISRFPEYAALYVHAGDLCRSLKRFDEAFDHWNKALALDPSYLDAVYSMGFCYQELGQYDRAHHVWSALTRELDRRGLVVERECPAKLAAECLNQRT